MFINKGPERIAELRAQGKDPAHGNEAGKKMGDRNREHQSAIQQWEVNEHRQIYFETDALAALQSLPLDAMMAATGLSLRYCSLTRRGLRKP